MAATQTEGRGSSGKGASGGGGLSLEMKMLLPILLLLAILSLFPFFYIIWMSLNTVSLINGISFDFAGLANWTRMFTDVIVGAAWVRAALYFVATVGLENVVVVETPDVVLVCPRDRVQDVKKLVERLVLDSEGQGLL